MQKHIFSNEGAKKGYVEIARTKGNLGIKLWTNLGRGSVRKLVGNNLAAQLKKKFHFRFLQVSSLIVWD